MIDTENFGTPTEKECEALMVLRDVIIIIHEEMEKYAVSNNYLTALRDTCEFLATEAIRKL